MKRGASGLSMVLGVVKPSGMSSHDVVNRVRRVFGERRVGHAGTLDPFASGVLPVLVGPATRLDRYMSGHDKSYVAEIAFGVSTTTDDRCGEALHEGPVPPCVSEESFAKEVLDAFVGKSMQMPPAYSAIKVGGRKACDEARRGNIIKLEPRPIEVYSASLLEVGQKGEAPVWKAAFRVSKGTYVRALARDIGAKIGVPSHLAELERREVGCIGMDDCCPLDSLEDAGASAAVDPVRLLGLRVVFPKGVAASKVANGGRLDAASLSVFSYRELHARKGCECMPSLASSSEAFSDGELFSVVVGNKLAAIYRFDGDTRALRPDCVFQTEVSRGADI